MAKRTKKVGSVGRYQARYGVRARTRVRNVEVDSKNKTYMSKLWSSKSKTNWYQYLAMQEMWY